MRVCFYQQTKLLFLIVLIAAACVVDIAALLHAEKALSY